MHDYICAHCLFVMSNLSTARVSQVFFNTCMRGWEGVGSGVFLSLYMVGTCCWRGGYVLAGVEIVGLPCMFLLFCRC